VNTSVIHKYVRFKVRIVIIVKSVVCWVVMLYAVFHVTCWLSSEQVNELWC